MKETLKRIRQNLKIMQINKAIDRDNDNTEKKNGYIEYAYAVLTKEEIDRVNLQIMINSNFWLGGDYTAKDIKKRVINLSYFSSEEQRQIINIINDIDLIQNKYNAKEIDYSQALFLADEYRKTNNMIKEPIVSRKQYIKKK